ncbi:MAG: hypothetical protein GY719_27835 [bacterium]|nr:hypothetical protein [bacterium]
MKLAEISAERLDAESCRDETTLQAFVQDRISVNAWPIFSRPLRNLIRRRGLDLTESRDLQLSLDTFMSLAREVHHRSRRVERTLRIDNAFHHTLHNFDVALRLLLLEWEEAFPVPEDIRCAAYRKYDSFDAVETVLAELLERMLSLEFPADLLARDVLAAFGHDYGHAGGTDRMDGTGELLPLTHEDVAEKHIAKLGIEIGLPPAVILEALAGIRATTLHVRAGRDKIQAANDFERRMMLADVAGCVKRPDLWMTHVAIPVLDERILPWQRRVKELPREIARLRQRLDSRAEDDPDHQLAVEQLADLEAEDQAVIKTVSEAFSSELRFLTFIRAHRLAPVPAGCRLWADRVDRRIELVEHLLAREDLLEPLDGQGFPLVVEMTVLLANSDSLEGALAGDAVHPNLRQLFAEFIPADAAVCS